MAHTEEPQSAMSSLPCPLPEVEAALAPFIHTRQEALSIRLRLAQFLQSLFVDAGTFHGHLHVACPSPGTEVAQIPTEVAGLRKKYFEALEANLAVRKQYDALRNDLDGLQTTASIADTGTEAASEKALIQDYISLLRQRQRGHRLNVIQRTLCNLLAAEPNPAKTDPKAMVNKKLGEPPLAPIAAGAPVDAGSHVDALLFKLKGEVLTAKRSKDRSDALLGQARELVHATPEPTVEARAHALGCARDELVSWIEGELAKMSDDGTEVAETASSLHVNRGVPEDGSPEAQQRLDEIQKLYDKYIATRTSLIASLNVATAVSSQQPAPPEKLVTPSALGPIQTPSPQGLSTREILPYIPGLLQVSRDERSLVQQSTYLRRQLAIASDETVRTVRRLAGESHLVAPGADNMAVWAAAAEASSANTESCAREHLEAGETHVAAAKRTLRELRMRKGAFGRLDGTL